MKTVRDARREKLDRPTKSDLCIKRAYDRAAEKAWNVTREDQIARFAASEKQMSDERGSVQCAAGFAAQALAKLDNGDLDGFLASMRLAGQFSQQASDAFYSRTHK